MNIILFFLFSLITQCLSQTYFPIVYQKMKKSHGFDDDICAYPYSTIFYVKPCEEGKFCKNYGDLSKCEEIETKIEPIYLNKECSSDYECDAGLTCKGVCQYICPSPLTQEPYKTSEQFQPYSCRNINKPKNLLYEYTVPTGTITYNDMLSVNQNDNTKTIFQYISYFQVAGKIDFFKNTDNNSKGNLFAIQKIESSYIGTVEDGKFVMDKLACQSGFALYFYPDGSLKDPSSDRSNKMYLKCVTLEDVDVKNNMIKYNGGLIYNIQNYFNTQEFDTSMGLSPRTRQIPIGYLSLTQNQIFAKYKSVFTQEKQESCEKENKFLEQRTCEDNEARKWWYFYRNPNEYVLYYDEEDKDNDITNYLLQIEYRTFISGSYLFTKFIIPIIMFLFL